MGLPQHDPLREFAAEEVDFFEADTYCDLYSYYWTPERTREEAEFIASYCTSYSVVLDIACGFGRHALAVADILRGSNCTIVGCDRNRSLIDAARARTRELDETIRLAFQLADATEFRQPCDVAYIVGNSLGYEGEEGDVRLLRNAARNLRPGGRLIVQETTTKVNPGGAAWFGAPGMLVLEERRFDPTSSWLRVSHLRLRPQHAAVFAETRLRMYGGTELLDRIKAVGFTVESVYADVDRRQYSEADVEVWLVARLAEK